MATSIYVARKPSQIVLSPLDPLSPSPYDGMCCNTSGASLACENKAQLQCEVCKLVQYCGTDCELAHREIHQLDCSSPYITAKITPLLDKSGQDPLKRLASTISSTPPSSTVSSIHFLWGNTPAYDVLKLSQNEGSDYDRCLVIGFAASGDLRNVTKTIAELPVSYSRHIDCLINDMDPEVIKKNIFLLLIALCFPEDEEFAVEAMVDFWFSMKLCQTMFDKVQERLHPIIDRACESAINEPDEFQTITFGRGPSLRILLPEEQWRSLKGIWKPELQSPENTAIADQSWKRWLQDPNARAVLDSVLMGRCSGGARLAELRFRETGVLQPFGASVSDRTLTNPTMFSADYKSLVDLNPVMTPRKGYQDKDIQNNLKKHGLPDGDEIGGTYLTVRDMLIKFHRNIANRKITFSITSMMAKDAIDNKLLHFRWSFDRIDTSNIADKGWLGIDKTLELTKHLKRYNKHATLLTYFMCILKGLPPGTRIVVYQAVMQQLFEKDEEDNEVSEVPVADLLLQWYENSSGFKDIAQKNNALKKVKNTIFGWALPSAGQNAESGQEEGDFQSQINVAGLTASYIEWKRWHKHSGEEWTYEESGFEGWYEDPQGVQVPLWEALKALEPREA